MPELIQRSPRLGTISKSAICKQIGRRRCRKSDQSYERGFFMHLSGKWLLYVLFGISISTSRHKMRKRLALISNG